MRKLGVKYDLLDEEEIEEEIDVYRKVFESGS